MGNCDTEVGILDHWGIRPMLIIGTIVCGIGAVIVMVAMSAHSD
ncbi:MAG: hypothetical protein VZQ83_06270 [Eubacterium sp.]|nr:hypothetical protein [Eubacterium sp.]